MRKFKLWLPGTPFITSAGVVVSTAAFLSFAIGYSQAVAKDMPGFEQRRQCDVYYEPSGITQLVDGRIVVVDDEENQPISILTLNEKLTVSIETPNIDAFFPGLSKDDSEAAVSDLEAIATDGRGFIYAITSHSRTRSGERSATREQLLRFRVSRNKLEDASARVDLRKAMARVDEKLKSAAKVADVKDGNGFNIEGLSFNKVSDKLMIGLRNPVVDGKAVIIAIKNPHALFDKSAAPNFASSPIYLSLDRGGIRAMAFAPKLGGYLIVSSQEKEDEQFKLWLWSGNPSHAPLRVHINGKFDLSNAEGITPIRHHGSDWIMLAFDNGKKPKRNKGCYAFLAYDQLEVNALTD